MLCHACFETIDWEPTVFYMGLSFHRACFAELPKNAQETPIPEEIITNLLPPPEEPPLPPLWCQSAYAE
ncbi:hypothetical protein M0R04_06585 [Candidatus Dojkabacteria bacterium]|jgi:hypothetical protein|nr:hypothetical protein [Candidatus Dojkabacteria bacterium]